MELCCHENRFVWILCWMSPGPSLTPNLEVDALALSYRAIGVVDKDMVAVFMTNSPEMVFSLYALSKLGATVALLNSALRGMLWLDPIPCRRTLLKAYPLASVR